MPHTHSTPIASTSRSRSACSIPPRAAINCISNPRHSTLHFQDLVPAPPSSYRLTRTDRNGAASAHPPGRPRRRADRNQSPTNARRRGMAIRRRPSTARQAGLARTRPMCADPTARLLPIGMCANSRLRHPDLIRQHAERDAGAQAVLGSSGRGPVLIFARGWKPSSRSCAQ